MFCLNFLFKSAIIFANIFNKKWACLPPRQHQKLDKKALLLQTPTLKTKKHLSYKPAYTSLNRSPRLSQ